MRSGIDAASMETSVRPQDDLFRHVNGSWLESAAIAADRPLAGTFVTLADAAELHVRAIIEQCRADATGDPHGTSADDEPAKVGAFYAAFMDEESVERAGADPIADDLRRIDAITDRGALVDALGALERLDAPSALGCYVGVDSGDPDRYVLNVVQAGLGLPDEAYYHEDAFAEVRAAYRTHVERMLELAGLDDAPARAAGVYALEERLAGAHWDRVANRDAVATYNLLTRDALDAATPGLDWSRWAAAAQIDESALDEVVVGQPSYLSAFGEAVADADLQAWKDWLRWQVVRASAAYLSSAFVQESFDFYGRILSGTDELRARWKRGVAAVDGALGEAVGKLYVERHFPPSARERMDELVANLLEAYRRSISALPWMSEETRGRALDKLAAFTPKVGYPTRWRDYAALTVDAGDLLGNVRRAASVAMDRELAKLGGPIDREEWLMTPQTVNAYYNPTMNEIVFPAAILQPPFFDADADAAVNYGGIGAVIGHEIGHGFDDQGSRYDGTGALHDWWTTEDREAFEKLTASLVQQYAALSPAGADGQVVNGELTLGENIGDLGGLGIAYQAYAIACGDEAPPVLDGLTGAQRFFVSWARCWQGKVRPAEVVRRLTIDPHSPPEFRANQVVRNLDAFHEAFGVGPDDTMWLDPLARVTIW